MAHTLTVDFEGWSQIAWHYTTGELRPVGGEALKRQTGRLLSLLARHNVTATFFVLGATARAWPTRIGELQAAGHEIASHGFGHARACSLSPAALEADLRRSRALLTDLAGVAPSGYRAPEFSITRRSRWVFDAIANAGFRYDSSVFPIRTPRYGLPGAPRLATVSANSLVELPLATVWSPLGNLPLAGGGWWRRLPASIIRAGLHQMSQRGESATLYLHPFEIDDRDPPPISGRLTPSQRRFAHRFHRRQCHGRGRFYALLDRVLAEHSWQTASEHAHAVAPEPLETR